MFTSFHSDPPTVQINVIRPAEKDIYKTMWSKPEYRTVAPGEHCAMDFLAQAQPKKGETVLDLGMWNRKRRFSFGVFWWPKRHPGGLCR
jgi:hypothetical protein